MSISSLFGGGAPTPPNPQTLIKQQQKSNTAAFKQGLVSTSNPFGTANYTTGKNGTQLTTNLSPGQQAIFNPAQGAAATYAGQLPSQPFSMADVPSGMDLASNFYNQQKALLQPEFDAQNKSLDVQAAERGLPFGSEAYNGLMDPTKRAQSLALQNAAYQGVQLTPAEQQRQLQDALAIRELPFQEAGSALGIQNSVQQPQVMTPLGAPQPVNAAQITQQNYLNQVAANQAQNSALGSILGAAGTVGGAIAGGPIGAAAGKSLGNYLTG